MSSGSHLRFLKGFVECHRFVIALPLAIGNRPDRGVPWVNHSLDPVESVGQAEALLSARKGGRTAIGSLPEWAWSHLDEVAGSDVACFAAWWPGHLDAVDAKLASATLAGWGELVNTAAGSLEFMRMLSADIGAGPWVLSDAIGAWSLVSGPDSRLCIAGFEDFEAWGSLVEGALALKL